jgi:septum formation protein
MNSELSGPDVEADGVPRPGLQAPQPLILASASPRRKELLEQLGIHVIAHAVDIDESVIAGESAGRFVQRLAMEKARRGHEVIENPGSLPVLGSDTIVVADDEILGKPVDRDDARSMLVRLSGKTHTVHTAVAIVTENRAVQAVSISRVSFTRLSEQDISLYLSTGEADDKAGSYAIQGIAGQFIEKLEGSYSGVMGLPLFETRQLLLQLGINPLTGIDK